jgi:hypothetical protein
MPAPPGEWIQRGHVINTLIERLTVLVPAISEGLHVSGVFLARLMEHQ